jgi:hypothetical protein
MVHVCIILFCETGLSASCLLALAEAVGQRGGPGCCEHGNELPVLMKGRNFLG